MMLTSCRQMEDAAPHGKDGVCAQLTKPVRRAELRKALLQAISGISQPDGPRPCWGKGDRRREENDGVALRILVAEDNPVNQHLATKLLEKRGHIVTVASNGLQATTLLDQGEYDLALMDVQMPVMDGFEATAALRRKEMRTGRHLPVIAVTAYAMKGDEERCRQAGMDAYVTKPLTEEDLYAAIEVARTQRDRSMQA
jgi:CheY-like chemotaxis protein